jgi:nitrogen fixation-related uncharacterized protein
MGWTAYITVIFGFASLFFLGAALALHWAHRNGQLENLERGSRSIFDDEEPEGVQTDHFPSKGKKR